MIQGITRVRWAIPSYSTRRGRRGDERDFGLKITLSRRRETQATYSTVLLGRTPVRRREGNAPEVWCGRIELDGDVRTVRHLPRAPCHAARDALFGLAVFEDESTVCRQPMVHDQQGASATYAEGARFNGSFLALQRDVDFDGYAQHYALYSTAILLQDDWRFPL